MYIILQSTHYRYSFIEFHEALLSEVPLNYSKRRGVTDLKDIRKSEIEEYINSSTRSYAF